MEEGEVWDSTDLHPPLSYTRGTQSTGHIQDQSYECSWDKFMIAQGLDSGSSSSALDSSGSCSAPRSIPTENTKRCMRLVVFDSRVLPKSHRLALIDGYSEVQLGRDAPVVGLDSTPRIRLKEMEVSKLHATIYWDEVWNEWGVVDMGSKHGTFLRSAIGSSQYEDERGMRLSSSKVASVPRRLYHSDQLTIGNTTFTIHIHGNVLPCEECSPKGGDEIPLCPTARRTIRPQAFNDVAITPESCTSSSHPSAGPRNHKAAITQLKRNLLTRHSNDLSVHQNRSSGQYVDRSARRRALHPPSQPDAPGTATILKPPFGIADRSRRSLHFGNHEATSMPELVSQPAAPLPESSIGHVLLVKQGWQPGTALGIAGEGRIDPLEVKASYQRQGLGLISGQIHD